MTRPLGTAWTSRPPAAGYRKMDHQGRQTPRVSASRSNSLRAAGEERTGSPVPGPTVGGSSGPGTAPDAVLARAAARGDDEACGELIRRYRARIYRVAYGYVGDHEEALDITQETFLQMVEGLPRFREQANFYTWLHRIALNRCLDWARRRTRHP